MARYRKIDPRIWNDEKFRKLTDDGKLIFLFLLTHPHMTMIGAMRASVPGLAAEIGWGLTRFDKAFGEALAKGMVKHDPSACFVSLPRFLKYNPPESPNVVQSWRSVDALLPECETRIACFLAAKAFAEDLGEAFAKAFAKAFAEGFDKPCPNQEQEQEQEQDSILLASASTHLLTWDRVGGWSGVSDLIREAWTEAYPACDINRQLAAMSAWLMANPRKAKKSNWLKFANSWLTRSQDRGGDAKSTSPNVTDEEPVTRPSREAIAALLTGGEDDR